MERLDKDVIQDRLKMNLNKVKMGYKKVIDDVENGIFFSKAILKPYKSKVDKMAIYGDLFRETKKHWETSNVEKLQRRTYKANFFSGDSMIMEKEKDLKLPPPIKTAYNPLNTERPDFSKEKPSLSKNTNNPFASTFFPGNERGLGSLKGLMK